MSTMSALSIERRVVKSHHVLLFWIAFYGFSGILIKTSIQDILRDDCPDLGLDSLTHSASEWLNPSSGNSYGDHTTVATDTFPSERLHENLHHKASNQRDEAEKPSTTTKTLVILMGGLRGGEPTWTTLFRNVLDINQADLAVLTQDNFSELYKGASILSRARYVWYIPTYKDWADAMDLVHNSTAWREPVFRMFRGGRNILLGGIKGPLPSPVSGSAAIIFMYRWFVSQRILEHGLVGKYERFVVTRPDHFYTCPHDFRTLEKGYIYVPEGEDWRGICDRHVICGSEHILKVLDVLPPLLQHPEKYQPLLGGSFCNSEMFLQHRWSEEGLLPLVRRYPRNMFISSMPYDYSGWRNASVDVGDAGVRIKYEEEYKAAVRTCVDSTKQRLLIG